MCSSAPYELNRSNEELGFMAPPLARKFRAGDRVYVRAQQVWMILVSLVMSKEARASQLPTYGDIAEKMGLDRRAGIGLGRELGIIGQWCIANKFPAINCVVVSQETGTPGPGVV